MTEPAKGKRGFLLYDPAKTGYFFRIYHDDEQGRKQFTDYDICVNDLAIEISDNFTVLNKDENGNRLEYKVR